MAVHRGQEILDFIEQKYVSRTLHSSLVRLLATLRDEDSSIVEIHRILSYDQVLAERVLRVANSALFGHSGKISDLRHAVLFLGLEKIRSIALGMGVLEVFPSGGVLDARELWAHCYEVASLSSILAEEVTLTDPAESFLSGLLHDIGRVIFFERDRTRFSRIGTCEDMTEREEDLFGCTHAEAGGWYVQKAGFPVDIVTAIRFHHEPSKAQENRLSVSIVSLAEALSRRFHPRIQDDGIWTAEHHAMLLELALHESAMNGIRERFSSLKGEIEVFFG